MTLRAYLLIALAAIVLACGAFWIDRYGDDRYAAGQAEVQSRWDAETIQRSAVALRAERENAAITFNRVEAVTHAENQSTARAAVNGRAADGARAESAGLRSDLAASAAARAGDVSSGALDACRADAATRDAVLAELAEEAAGLASAADGHANDSLKYQEAWPK